MSSIIIVLFFSIQMYLLTNYIVVENFLYGPLYTMIMYTADDLVNDDMWYIHSLWLAAADV